MVPSVKSKRGLLNYALASIIRLSTGWYSPTLVVLSRNDITYRIGKRHHLRSISVNFAFEAHVIPLPLVKEGPTLWPEHGPVRRRIPWETSRFKLLRRMLKLLLEF